MIPHLARGGYTINMFTVYFNETLTASDPLWWGNWLFVMSILFFMGGTAGWILELFFRRFVSQKHWVNPGFLVGPIVPLYGFGNVILFIFSSLPWANWIPNAPLRYITVILVLTLAMTLIEYIAGLIFIKGLKIKLWDYSNRWGNIQGIICPIFSLAWGALGAGYFFFLYPPLLKLMGILFECIYPYLFTLGLLYGVLAVDVGYSFHIVAKVKKVISDAKLVVDWDRIKMSFSEHHKKLKERAPWLFAFAAETEEFKKMLVEYKENLVKEISAKLASRRSKKHNKDTKDTQ